MDIMGISRSLDWLSYNDLTTVSLVIAIWKLFQGRYGSAGKNVIHGAGMLDVSRMRELEVEMTFIRR